ncbi:MAG: hypothetical protein OEO84_15040, partial [Betaproteobacteria bacterium]|nr:hypothetical protein [Betaproteobacteria bacterium]
GLHHPRSRLLAPHKTLRNAIGAPPNRGKHMRFNVLAGIVAMTLFVGYYGPIVIKLKELPLTIVVIGGIVLVAVDLWESLRDSNR